MALRLRSFVPDYVWDRILTLFIMIHVYFLGAYYSIAEFFYDRRWEEMVPSQLQRFVQFRSTMSAMNIEAKLEEWRKNDLTGKNPIAVLTGADGTIGLELLKMLTTLQFTVYCVGNRPSVQIRGRVRFIRCDLADVEQIKECAKDIVSKTPRVDLFISAAGVMFLNSDQLNGGFHYLINVESNKVLFYFLSSHLERSNHPAAIFLSSCCSRAGCINGRRYQPESFVPSNYLAYANSKFLLNHYARVTAFQREIMDNKKVHIFAVHPGVVPGKLYANTYLPRMLINFILAKFLRTPRQAAFRTLSLAFVNFIGPNGSYYEHRDEPIPIAEFGEKEFLEAHYTMEPIFDE